MKELYFFFTLSNGIIHTKKKTNIPMIQIKKNNCLTLLTKKKEDKFNV
jgi:hypothetical protein